MVDSRLGRRTFLTAGALAGAGLAGVCTGLPPTAAGTAFQVHPDLGYAAPVGRGHLLDLYLPVSRAGPHPVVVYNAGSAFLSDDTKVAPTGLGGMTTPLSLAEMWAPHGYAIAGVNIRSSSQTKFPGQLHDIKAAIRFLRARAADYGLDVHRFATMGTSSGGWTATMAGVTGAVADLEGDLGNADQSSSVGAVIDLFGPTDFQQMDAHRLPNGQRHDPADSPESLLMGYPLQSNPAGVQRANPAAYVSADSPPIFIAHGLADPLVPFNQSEILFAAYESAGATASLTLVPGAVHTDEYLSSAAASAGRTVIHTSHGVTTTGSQPAPTYDTLLGFLDTHLRA
ncbi:MAG: prolyl oligopeptidase family serine peptidase [Mycolicibacterium sp.]|uniref:prolyl oligopeptidase family serine peptidase n=1 Tax=Mycolicibacterium sp. TaxID=2320850 RepID=UPI003D0E68B8